MKSLFPSYRPAAPKVIAFDWGGTVMQELPYTGRMTDWPEVLPVEGAAAALAALASEYRLVIATNAVESDAAAVRSALERVDLGGYFEAVFTRRQTLARKPDAAFYRHVCAEMGIQADELVFVGDDLINDAVGPALAGCRGIWFNPLRAAVPGLLPIYSQEVVRLEDLPRAVNALAEIPPLDLCLGWYVEQGASAALLAHVSAVASAACGLAHLLAAAGTNVDVVLAQRGGLLHDIGRAGETRGHAHHLLGAELLAEQSLNRLAGCARNHMLFGPLEGYPPSSLEEKLVYFADKLVEGGQLMRFDARLSALALRYAIPAAKIEAIQDYLVRLESDLAGLAGLEPGKLFSALAELY